MEKAKTETTDEDEKRKKEILENIYCEIGDVMDCDDEAVAEQWAFELNI